jgi:hypothetical protein
MHEQQQSKSKCDETNKRPTAFTAFNSFTSYGKRREDTVAGISPPVSQPIACRRQQRLDAPIYRDRARDMRVAILASSVPDLGPGAKGR